MRGFSELMDLPFNDMDIPFYIFKALEQVTMLVYMLSLLPGVLPFRSCHSFCPSG